MNTIIKQQSILNQRVDQLQTIVEMQGYRKEASNSAADVELVKLEIMLNINRMIDELRQEVVSLRRDVDTLLKNEGRVQ
jgi:hypothetical protein